MLAAIGCSSIGLKLDLKKHENEGIRKGILIICTCLSFLEYNFFASFFF